MFELKVAFRFLKEGKSQTLFILLGIAVGVGVQVFLSFLISGLQRDLINKTVGDSPHIWAKPADSKMTPLAAETTVNREIATSNKEERLTNWQKMRDGIEQMSGVKAVSPLVEFSAFLNKGQKNLSVVIKGIYAEKSELIYGTSKRMVEGYSGVQGNNIVIGKDLGKDLNIGIGDTVRITSSTGNEDYFYITGIYDFENQGINMSWVFMDLNRASKFSGMPDGISVLEIQINNVFAADQQARTLRSYYYPDAEFDTWQEANKQLLTALKSQTASSNVIQFFVLMAVALGITSVLSVTVMQKSKQIGILKAMGADNGTTTRIFLLQGGLLGLLGGIVGDAAGIVLVKAFVFFTSKGGKSLFNVVIDNNYLYFSVTVATFVGLLAALAPAIKSAKLNPIEVIRNG